MENRKRNLIVIVLLLIGTVLITIGTTIAFFNYAKTGSTENSIETGHLSFIYEEVSKIGNGISIVDALPTSDVDGKTLTGTGKVFDFKVTSTTTPTVSIPYEITTRVVDGSDDLTDYVKVYLTTVNVNSEEEKVLSIYSDLNDSTNVLASKYGDKTLYTDTIAQGSTNYTDNYRLRMWIDDSADFSDESFNDKSFSIKVNVYAVGSEVVNQPVQPSYTVVSGDINTIGSEICLDTECFNIVGFEDDNHVKLLAKKPLKVGNGFDENTPGYLLQYDDYTDGHGITFSNEDYWLDDNGDRKAKYTEEDGNGNYYIYDENSNLYSYVNAYTEYLQNQGFNITKGRLLSVNDVKDNFGCIWYYDNYSCSRDFIDSDNFFWMGNDEELYYVMMAIRNGMSGSNYDISGGYAVQPLVVLEK